MWRFLFYGGEHMKGALTKRIVKVKKIQKVGDNLMVLLPKAWLDEMDWTRMTQMVLEFLPHRKTLILSEKEVSNEEISDIIPITD